MIWLLVMRSSWGESLVMVVFRVVLVWFRLSRVLMRVDRFWVRRALIWVRVRLALWEVVVRDWAVFEKLLAVAVLAVLSWRMSWRVVWARRAYCWLVLLSSWAVRVVAWVRAVRFLMKVGLL